MNGSILKSSFNRDLMLSPNMVLSGRRRRKGFEAFTAGFPFSHQ